MVTQMNNIPLKYIYDRGFHEVAYWFKEKVANERAGGRIPVYYHDVVDSFVYVICDEQGYPQRPYWEFITMTGLPKLMPQDISTIPFAEVTYSKKVVKIDRPEVFYKVNDGISIFGKDYFFLWNGELIDKQEIPVEQLDIKYLLKIAQEAIKKREPIILDEVTKNKLIK